MQATDLAANPALNNTLQLLSWLVIIFGTVWFGTTIMRYYHRRAYNLTLAESGGSGPIVPDFLTIDKKKRQEAIERGEVFDEIVARRAAFSGPSPYVAKLGSWSRVAALITAAFTLLTTIFGALTQLDSLQEGVEQLSSWDSLTTMVQTYPAGALVALIVIGVNVIVIFLKTPEKKSTEA